MPDKRFENCPDHGVRRCLVCNPPKGRIVNTARPGEKFPNADTAAKLSKDDIPEVLNYDVPDAEEEQGRPYPFSPDPPFEIPNATPKDPLVSAAEDYSRACRIHMAAQSEVGIARQALEDAKKHEDTTYKTRVEAQTKLAELVSKTTEAVL